MAHGEAQCGVPEKICVYFVIFEIFVAWQIFHWLRFRVPLLDESQREGGEGKPERKKEREN